MTLKEKGSDNNINTSFDTKRSIKLDSRVEKERETIAEKILHGLESIFF